MTDRRVTLVQCLACGHTATMDRETDSLPLVRLTKRLVCSVCGARTMKAERVTATHADMKPKRH